MTRPASIVALCALLLVPFGVMSSVIHQGHVYALMWVCFVGLSLSLPSLWCRGFGLYVAGWWLFVMYRVWIGAAIPELHAVAIDAALFLMFGMVALLAVYHSTFPQQTWFNVICIAALIQAIIGILQVIGCDPISTILSSIVIVRGENPFTTPTGTLGNQNFLGAFLAISMPFFFRVSHFRHFCRPRIYFPLKWHGRAFSFKVNWHYCLPIIILGLIIAHTSAACFAAAMGAAFYFGGWIGFFCLAIAGTGYLYFFDYQHIFQADRWQFAADIMQKVGTSWKSAWFGFGPGITWEAGNTPHNEYTWTLFNYGSVGLGIMTGYILTAYRDNRMLFTAFLILCINMIGNHALHTTPTALLAIIIIALMERERKETV